MPPHPRLARGHALAPGLVCALVPTAGGSVIDLCNDRGSGAGTVAADGPLGPSARDWSIPNAICSDLQFTSGAFTVAAFVNRESNPGSGEYPPFFELCDYTSETVNHGWILQVRPAGDATPGWAFGRYRNNATTSGTGSLVLNTNNTTGDHLIVGTSNGNNSVTLYVDGSANTATASVNVNPLSSTGPLQNASTAGGKMPAYFACAWNRRLLGSEVAALWSDPAALFSQRRNRLGWTAALAAPAAVLHRLLLLGVGG